MREFNDYLKENGIIYKVTASYSLEQNGKAERVNPSLYILLELSLLNENSPSHDGLKLQK